MKSRLISMFLLTVLLSLVIVSAAFTISRNSLEFAEKDSLNLTLSPDTLSNYTITLPEIKDQDDITIPIDVFGDNVSGNKILNIDSDELLTVSVDVDFEKDLLFGKIYTGDMIIKDDSSLDEELVTVNIQETLCEDGEKSSDDFELRLNDVDIENDDGDDLEWIPLNSIIIDVEVESIGDDEVEDVVIELAVYDSDGDDVTDDLEDLEDEQIEIGDLDEGDEETVTFEFKVSPDFDDGTYFVALKAYSDGDEDEVCTSKYDDYDSDSEYFEEVEVEKETDEDKQIIVDNIVTSPSTAQCGEIVQVSADVINIGDEDYEDQVRVTMEISELGVELEEVITGDFDEGDDDIVEFQFTVPEDAEEKIYTLEFRTYYDYNDRHDVYEIVSDDKFINERVFSVEGNCGEEEPPTIFKSVRITAELDDETPEALAGEELIINANLRNTGSVDTNYAVSVFGNSAWSSLVSLEPQTLTLAPGESGEVNIILNIDDDASGDEEFTIRAAFDDRSSEQEVSLSINGEEEVQTDEVLEHLRRNWFIYLIIVVNIILIIAIILVVRRMVAPRQI
ncbi:putative S-layer protein [Candidatus Pacearchaeota archaeon]|nr:putative S-layer protein [Candidatus Pacearchaeota archaeon]MBD3283694.1 putative S-layer protein [Candidatus Pacearchaeota archaeon]